MKAKELKTKISHTHSLILSQTSRVHDLLLMLMLCTILSQRCQRQYRCVSRLQHDTDMQGCIKMMVAGDKQSHTVQLFDLEKQLGTAPDGWHRDTSHMERCLVCEMQAAAEVCI